ncbi:hypothetical protein [Methylomonas sp. AM2-LC]|uniref:hypothetical protein n=1 Tax=Methylomonas sp. AM2-LC TaxID=3153301 RepID=UPI0032630434
MRITLYVIGLLFSFIALFCFLLLFGTPKDWLIGLIVGCSFLFGGAVLLTAAIKNYLGGWYFLSAILLLSIALFFLGGVYHFIATGVSGSFIPLLWAGLVCLVLGLILLRLGHKLHKKRWAVLVSEALAAANALAIKTEVESLRTGNDSLAPFPSKVPVAALYPPMTTWRTFLLMVFSGSLYSIFLTYRTSKDLYTLGENSFRPKRDAALILMPLYGLLVFMRMAKTIASLTKKQGMVNKVSASMLTVLLILAGILSVSMPTFLYPLTISVVVIPWLILHQQMNRLRQGQSTDWLQPVNQYTWRQRCVFILGVPLMGLAIYGSKADFQYFKADNLAVGAALVGQSLPYQLHIPDRNWRVVPVGTMYNDTDMELMNKPSNEWVVIRVQPNQHQTLDSLVDNRKAIIAANWKDFKVVETRTLDSGAHLTPVSIAHYSHSQTSNFFNQSFFVATIVTTKTIYEVIGQGSKHPASTVQELVNSFQLTATEGNQ